MDKEQDQLDLFLERVSCSPELRSRLRGADPYAIVAIAEELGFCFGVFTLHRATCAGVVMKRAEWPHGS
ncbi:Nif11-like leader peptide family natural product precursor [Synechococcus sp. CCY 9618]|uniref:Nif11-like leader peptide family natural product precursor n=1 Tax=Synechococcus sp. CCY 9618 TaxID=2815602 RepID=UPI001C249B87